MPDLRTPFVSIVICTYNRADLLRSTLESLLDLDGLEQAETIVVDNNSTDDTCRVAEQFRLYGGRERVRVHYLFEATQGLSAARNAGIRAAAGEVVAFLDDDAIPDIGWLRAIIDGFAERPDVHALGGVIRPNFEIRRPDWLQGPLERPYTIVDLGDRRRTYPVGMHPYGANMAIRRSAFAERMFPTGLGRSGASLLSGEETWLFRDMARAGLGVFYEPAMAVTHFIPASRLTREWILRRYYFQGVGDGLMNRSAAGRLVQLAVAGAKLGYLAADAVLSRGESRRLLRRCRLESLKGALRSAYGRANKPLVR